MKYLFTLKMLFFVCILSAQTKIERQVIASAGGSGFSQNVHLDWTLGESFVAQHITSDARLTEGFQQAFLIIETVLTPDIKSDFFDIQIKPNPTSSHISVIFNPDFQGNLDYEIFDLSGKSMGKHVVNPNDNYEIDMRNFSEGMYLLKFFYQDKSKTYRVIKTNGY